MLARTCAAPLCGVKRSSNVVNRDRGANCDSPIGKNATIVQQALMLVRALWCPIVSGASVLSNRQIGTNTGNVERAAETEAGPRNGRMGASLRRTAHSRCV
jgi:hypothetical protein